MKTAFRMKTQIKTAIKVLDAFAPHNYVELHIIFSCTSVSPYIAERCCSVSRTEVIMPRNRRPKNLTGAPVQSDALRQMQGQLSDLSRRLEALLGDYSRYVDRAMAEVTADYLRALQHDFELALERGESYRLEPILEDIDLLRHDTDLRIRQARGTNA